MTTKGNRVLPGRALASGGGAEALAGSMMTNCHIHTFTHEHTPERFLPWPVGLLIGMPWFRRALIWLAHHLSSEKHGRLVRYAEIVETSYKRSQAEVFEMVRGFYPEGTRFLVLAMDMEKMNAGKVEKSIDEQHEELGLLRGAAPGDGHSLCGG